jgi:hypothetical protein
MDYLPDWSNRQISVLILWFLFGNANALRHQIVGVEGP